ncbi:sialate O-acetylesterase [Pedobacter hiemivivus]|uniref:Sialate O-acetylesterase n=1 Tax=Pedobacter hiemivivus TaxID=2530454 RepID=A0A4U1GIW2_9SPHI|nr:sialate O-acetylesterase [Pedobacter hiemivivus]TCC99328.1 sialate O-acetylesterase [Pedobacter hiemivivus]TKC63824.1 sialate O-acetylesterase [Pedobacter hiemivivus]
MKKLKTIISRSGTTVLFLAFFVGSSFAAIKPASIFTDHMVLQQKADVAIWGWANAGSGVTLIPSWDKKKYTIKADANGKWKLKIATPKAGGPYEISISDGIALTLKDILIGEVWFCGGQSNMEMPMKGFKSQPILGSNEAILKSSNSQIRLYTVPRSSITERQDNSKPSDWKLAGPEAVSNFSATAYYFGKLLSEMLNVPVGLINDSYGGSTIEAWMSPELLKSFPEVKIPSKGDAIKEVSRTPTTLYNGMLYPAIGYGIRGAIWYQGESNQTRPDRYGDLFPAMVKEWRNVWGMGEFPFYYAQIAPFKYVKDPATQMGKEFNSAFIRDVQRKSISKISNSGMAVLMDIGEERNIHPADKEKGGVRLAYLALGNTYGVKGFSYASPDYESMTVIDGSAILKFQNASNGLTSFGKPLSEFEIAGEDKVFYPAKAVLSGSSVTVSSDAVKAPVAVRYAFKDFVIGDLYGNEGLPVSSFRTDDWEK